NTRRRMRVRVALGGRAVRRPARVTDAGVTAQRFFVQQNREAIQFARRPPAVDPAIDQRGDTGGIVAAIFQTLQRVDDKRRDVALTCNANNAAHNASSYFFLRSARIFLARSGFVTCRARPSTNASFSTFSVITLPAAT